MKVYYAHCLAIYNTPQEARDIALLERLGFEVYNPNNPEVADAMKRLKTKPAREWKWGTVDVMDYFRPLVARCDALAFRALPDGSIPSGVAKEIGFARDTLVGGTGLPVFELPAAVTRRALSVEATREYLAEIGQR